MEAKQQWMGIVTSATQLMAMGGGSSVKVALYCRVSKEEQAQEGLSLGAQEDRCRAFAHAKDWTVAQVYVDGGFSGKSLHRPAMQRLLADASAHVWEIVIFWRLDRLSRRQRDILYLLEDVLTPLGIGIQSATEPFDTTTPMGKAMLGMLAVFAQLERETIVERTKMGRAQSLKLGRGQGGKVPYGYVRTGRGQLKPDPVTAPTVRALFDRAAQGQSPYQLAEWLNTEGVAAPEGGRWWDRVIWKILQSPVYVGRVGHQESVPGHHSALVSDSVWATVQRHFARRQLGPRQQRPDFWVDGLLHCPECGEPLRGKYARHRDMAPEGYDDPVRRYRFYYVCARRKRGAGCTFRYWRAKDIHAQVLEALRRWHADPTELERALAAQYPETATPDPGWVAQTAAWESRVARWYEAYESGIINAPTLRQRLDGIRQQQAAAEAVRPTLPVPASPDRRARADRIRVIVADLVGHWDRIPPAERQAILRLLIRDGWVTSEGRVHLILADEPGGDGIQESH